MCFSAGHKINISKLLSQTFLYLEPNFQLSGATGQDLNLNKNKHAIQCEGN